MISEILKTLSDTEIIVIAKELSNQNVDELIVFKQLVGKSNDNSVEGDLFNEVNSDNIRGTLPRLVCEELANRYKSLLENQCKFVKSGLV